MVGSIINRLIFLELIKIFFLALTALTGLFLIAGLLQEASQRGLSIWQVISIIPLLIPNMLPYTIPATTLFATCIVYGRMSADNEIIVLKAAGVNILHILKPAVLLGCAAAATTMALYYDTIPRTQRQLREKVMSDAEEVLYGIIKREGSLRQPGMNYVMYVREVQGKRLLDVVFKKRLPHGPGYEVVARTRKAHLRVNLETKDVTIEMGQCFVVGEGGGVGAAMEQSYPIPLPPSFGGKDWRDRSSALTWVELHERLGEAQEDYRQASVRQEQLALQRPSASAPADIQEAFATSTKGVKFEVEHKLRFVKSIEVELQLRPALAVGCLCFVLIGCPVGIWASRSDYLSIFVICFLPTLFVYYPLLLAGMNLAREGRAPAEIAVWVANGFLGSCALILIARLMRH